ncbi:MAG: type 2 lanthipeptide synthetase LanM family protein, partial [Leptolyngbyaceae cyanobacterium bins.59]|nr:type 2 lanthipeptide synthetase LanM family protein [Leptolyngbyaceae cyanobacterium bins.59]
RFTKRLDWDGLDFPKAVSLGEITFPSDRPFPTWTETLKAFLGNCLEDLSFSQIRCLDSQTPIPFEEVLLPFILVAQKKLKAISGNWDTFLATNAQATLERNLLTNLSQIAAQCLQVEFSVFQATQSFPPETEFPPETSQRLKYNCFVQHLLTGGFLPFFREYSVLARLMATLTDLWAEAIGEFIQRLATDWERIQQTFQTDRTLGKVQTIQVGLSDRHAGGRSVIACTFASGLKLVYKPKNIGSEEAFAQLLTWLNHQGSLLPFKVLKLLNCQTHGWIEWVENLPCQDTTAVCRYYQRSGMLLGLVYALEGMDCHRENLIACGEDPVLIDLEALLYHRVGNLLGEENRSPQSLISEPVWNSVLRVGMLPYWLVGSDGQSFDISALGGDAGQTTASRTLRWHHINTDQMTFEIETVQTRSYKNRPFLADSSISLKNYQDEIVTGFQSIYRLLMKHRAELTSASGPLASLAHQPIRFIFRVTKLYSYLSRRTLQPKFMRDGLDRSIELDALSRALLGAETRHPFWSLVRLEHQALEQLDIPLFMARADRHTLLLDAEEALAPCFEESAYDRAMNRLKSLSEMDLTYQTRLIRDALIAYTVDRLQAVPFSTFEETVKSQSIKEEANLTEAELLQQARTIADDIKQHSTIFRDGSVRWVSLNPLPPRMQKLQVQGVGYDFYAGCCGISLFLAAMAKVTGNRDDRDLALASLTLLRQVLHSPVLNQKLLAEMGIGGALGYGSIVYSLVKISLFLEEPALLEEARIAASQITPAVIAKDQKLDVMGGSAGAILGLLALEAIDPNPHWLQTAIEAGNHLLQEQKITSSGHKSWATLDDRFLAGFSHGAAGIAHALVRLYERTGETEFLTAVIDAIGYENSLFSPQVNNWADLRHSDQRSLSYMNSWCHGAAGITLMRMRGLQTFDSEAVQQSITAGLTSTLTHALKDIDGICCGNFGRIETLVVASSCLSRPDLLGAARKRATEVVKQAQEFGGFRLFVGAPRSAYNPTFFRGTAGIGYGLLRLSNPNHLPSVLLWD